MEKISLLIRVIGSICLVGGMSLGGILTADRFRGRLEELNGISRVFLMLRGEVEYHGLVLPEAIRSVGMRMDGGLKELLMGIAEKMEDGSGLPFGVIWRKALKQYFAFSYLNKEDQKLLLTMGNHLGYQDKRMQTSSIDLFLEEWKAEIEHSRRRLPGQCRIASCLGIVSGLLLAVIMI